MNAEMAELLGDINTGVSFQVCVLMSHSRFRNARNEQANKHTYVHLFIVFKYFFLFIT